MSWWGSKKIIHISQNFTKLNMTTLYNMRLRLSLVIVELNINCILMIWWDTGCTRVGCTWG